MINVLDLDGGMRRIVYRQVLAAAVRRAGPEQELAAVAEELGTLAPDMRSADAQTQLAEVAASLTELAPHALESTGTTNGRLHTRVPIIQRLAASYAEPELRQSLLRLAERLELVRDAVLPTSHRVCAICDRLLRELDRPLHLTLTGTRCSGSSSNEDLPPLFASVR